MTNENINEAVEAADGGAVHLLPGRAALGDGRGFLSLAAFYLLLVDERVAASGGL